VTDRVLELLLSDLRARPPLGNIAVVTTSWGYALSLPPAPGAEYRFVFAAEDADYRIEAHLLEAPRAKGDPAFWYHPFELEITTIRRLSSRRRSAPKLAHLCRRQRGFTSGAAGCSGHSRSNDWSRLIRGNLYTLPALRDG
jgi:hypothetical protein